MRKGKKQDAKEYDILFAYGDRHAPHQDLKLEKILIDIISDIQPDIIVDGGDMISADCLSTYSKKHGEMVGLQSELDEDYRWRVRIAAAAPNSTNRILLMDNHFFRRLDNKKRESHWMEDMIALQAESLLRVEELGWALVHDWSYKDQILFIHGDDKATDKYPASQKNPVNKVRSLVKDYGTSVVRFHSHVSGFEQYRLGEKERFGAQLGTFQDIYKTEYLAHKALVNWTTSAMLIYMSRTRSDDFYVVPVMFRNKGCVVNGKVYA